FFFQAEDGIRDGHVTGVQTCALPIFSLQKWATLPSGYDLKKRIEGSVAHFWSESYGQIYPILAHLASQGLVERRLERQKGKPDRQVYSITAEGQERLGAWLTAPARDESFRSELLLKLFFGRRRPLEESIRHL